MAIGAGFIDFLLSANPPKVLFDPCASLAKGFYKKILKSK